MKIDPEQYPAAIVQLERVWGESFRRILSELPPATRYDDKVTERVNEVEDVSLIGTLVNWKDAVPDLTIATALETHTRIIAWSIELLRRVVEHETYAAALGLNPLDLSSAGRAKVQRDLADSARASAAAAKESADAARAAEQRALRAEDRERAADDGRRQAEGRERRAEYWAAGAMLAAVVAAVIAIVTYLRPPGRMPPPVVNVDVSSLHSERIARILEQRAATPTPSSTAERRLDAGADDGRATR